MTKTFLNHQYAAEQSPSVLTREGKHVLSTYAAALSNFLADLVQPGMDARVLMHAQVDSWGAPLRQSVAFKRSCRKGSLGRTQSWQLEEHGCLSSQGSMTLSECGALIDQYPLVAEVQVERSGLRYRDQWLRTVTMQFPGNGTSPGVVEALIRVLPAGSFGVLDVQRRSRENFVFGLSFVMLAHSRDKVELAGKTLVADLFGVQGMLAAVDSPQRSLLQLSRLHPSSGTSNVRMVQGVELVLTDLFLCVASA